MCEFPIMTDQMKGVLLTAIGVLFITPDSLLIRLMDGPVLVTVFWRAAFAAVVVISGTVLVYREQTLTIYHRLGWYGLAYAAFMSLGTIMFVSAIQLTSVANTVFIASTAPVFAALVSRLFLGERISRRMLWTIALSLLGIAVIAFGSVSGHSSTGSDTPSLLGDLAALGAAIGLAIAFTAARAGRAVSMVPAVGISYLITVIVVLPFIISTPDFMPDAHTFWVYGALLGLVFVPLGTGFMALGPRYISSAEVSLLLLLEAVLAPLLVWAILKDYPGMLSIIGGAIVVSVLLISNLIKLRIKT